MRDRVARFFTLRSIIPPAVLAPVFVTLAMWSWRRWPDLLVDFGQ